MSNTVYVTLGFAVEDDADPEDVGSWVFEFLPDIQEPIYRD